MLLWSPQQRSTKRDSKFFDPLAMAQLLSVSGAFGFYIYHTILNGNRDLFFVCVLSEPLLFKLPILLLLTMNEETTFFAG